MTAVAPCWTARVLTIFPEMFPGRLGLSLAGKALESGLWALETVDMREFARATYRSVDDTPFGAGPGLVIRPDGREAAIAPYAYPDAAPLTHLSQRARLCTQAT